MFDYQQRSFELSEIETVESVKSQVNEGLMLLLEKMPVGVVKLHAGSQSIEWYNPYVSLIFSEENGEIDLKKLKELISVASEPDKTYAVFRDKRFAVNFDEENQICYFFDVSSEYLAVNRLMESRPVIGIISVDNYDALEDAFADSQISQVNTFLAQFVAAFADEYGIYYRRGPMDRFYLFTDYSVLNQLIQDKFSIIDKFRDESKKLDLPLTLSFGMAFGKGNHEQIGQLALQNLNMAEVRGGDQAVVKENDESVSPIFFGGGTASSVKRTRTRTRAMMTAVSDKLKTVSQVFVVGHKNLDMDALGSAVGMQLFAQNIMNNAYLVYDEKEMYPDIARAIHRLQEEHCSNLLSVDDALKMVDHTSILIMVDHSKIGLTLSKEFYERFSQVIVVDHHRRDADFPKNAVLTYIESGASSASELVTELIQFQNDKHHKLNRLQASLLMAGIMLDTKNFTSSVTSRTFDVASYLRARGSDNAEIKRLMSNDFSEFKSVSELVLKARNITEHVILISGSPDKEYDSATASKAADTVIDMSGIEAVFVVSRHVKGYISISARSKGNINVQKIMEEMGGGGHFSLAAAQVREKSLSEVVEDLERKIQVELAEE
ncbi:Phosphoesterase, DHH family protein [Streptococcus sp. DD13]|nr:DHH family phosphoesterase [Streptococcus sp. DD13]KXT77804.1 Phosphoesterase, DHH family protein [Streptococcus sp. DD13]